MGSLLDLANRMDRIANGLDDSLKEAKTAVALAIVQRLLDVTPVDTSKAVSNWRVSTGNAIAGAIAAHSEGKGGSTRGASVATALADATTAIEAARPQDLLVIFNNVPYIQLLNEGSSTQAPAGWIEQAILVGNSVARRYQVRLAK